MMSEDVKAEMIVDIIIADILNRKGLSDAYNEIDDDIKDEIREEWHQMIVEIIEE